jgi:hypothetical protein
LDKKNPLKERVMQQVEAELQKNPGNMFDQSDALKSKF